MTELHRWIVNPIFGRTTALSPRRIAVATLGAIAWHLLLVAFAWQLLDAALRDSFLLEATEWLWNKRPPPVLRNALIAAVAMLLEVLIAYGFWKIARWGQQRAVDGEWFLICWWRTCLLGTIVIPVALFTSGCFRQDELGYALIPPFLILTPAAIAGRVLPTSVNWRPVCPECGYTVAYAVVPRCTECGEPYPSADRFYRRWAIQRLPWDRRKRLLLYAYVSTVLMIILVPWRAAWRLGIPDRIGRAVRWWLGHILIPPLLLIALAAAMFGVAKLAGWIPAQQPDVIFADQQDQSELPWRSILTGFAPWAIVFSALCFFGIFLASFAPLLNRAARVAIAKWSLYLICLQPPAWIATWSLYFMPDLIEYILPTSPVSTALLDYLRSRQRRYPTGDPAGIAIIYAVWWSIGVASQPYLRWRGISIFLAALFTYLGAGWLILHFLNLRGFEGLL